MSRTVSPSKSPDEHHQVPLQHCMVCPSGSTCPHQDGRPLYIRQESERWAQAALQYRDMLQTTSPLTSRSGSPPNGLRSPPNLLNNNASCGPINIVGSQGSQPHMDLAAVPVSHALPVSQSLSAGQIFSPPIGVSLSEVSLRNRSSCQGSNAGSRGEQSSLELEAIAAVHELSFAVQSIAVSEILPRTPDLLFVNVTTIEGQPYCLELTLKGWRVTSLRQDCMNGDFHNLELHTRYFDSPVELMDKISPGYRELFAEKLAAKLRMLETDEAGAIAPASSFVRGSVFPENFESPPPEQQQQQQLHNLPTFAVRHPSGEANK